MAVRFRHGSALIAHLARAGACCGLCGCVAGFVVVAVTAGLTKETWSYLGAHCGVSYVAVPSSQDPFLAIVGLYSGNTGVI